jgi:hypothetical protein
MNKQRLSMTDFGVSLPSDWVVRIERVKGDYSRNKFIFRALRKAVLEEEEQQQEEKRQLLRGGDQVLHARTPPISPTTQEKGDP